VKLYIELSEPSPHIEVVHDVKMIIDQSHIIIIIIIDAEIKVILSQ